MELANFGIKINADAHVAIKQAAIPLFREYLEIFAWDHEDRKGIPRTLAEHTIDVVPNATRVQRRRYRMNPNYATRVKEELHKLLMAKFIFSVDSAPRLSPMVLFQKRMEH